MCTMTPATLMSSRTSSNANKTIWWGKLGLKIWAELYRPYRHGVRLVLGLGHQATLVLVVLVVL